MAFVVDVVVVVAVGGHLQNSLIKFFHLCSLSFFLICRYFVNIYEKRETGEERHKQTTSPSVALTALVNITASPLLSPCPEQSEVCFDI